MAIAGLDETVTSISVHPDFRQVSSFALGWVFITSLSCIISSSLIQRAFGFIRRRTFPSPDPERSLSEKLSIHSLDSAKNFDLRHGYFNTALFALPLCFLFASVANFASLLAFPLNGDATCAFVVAWGGMAAQSGRLVGALVVIFELRKMGIARREFWVAIVWLIIGIGFVFLNNAVGVGILTPFTPLEVAYCDRKHFLPASLVSSLLYFTLEVYAIARVMLFVASGRSMRQVIQDFRVLRPVSLLFLELLTLVPSAVHTNVVAEFVPFSVGAVAVLLAFDYRGPPSAEVVSPHLSTLSYVTYPSVQSMRRSTMRSSHSIQPPSPVAPIPPRRHPFSAIALNDPTLQTDEWTVVPRSARSTRTIDTVSAHSINSAVLQVGQRVHAASRNEDGPFDGTVGHENTHGRPSQTPWSATLMLSRPIVPSQAAFAERLDLDYAQARSLSARPRPTVDTPPLDAFNDDDVSDLISPASRIPGSDTFRLSRFGDGSARTAASVVASRRTSYRTSFAPDSLPSSPDSVVRSTNPLPLHDSRSIASSSERRRSVSLSLTQESSVEHRRSVSIPLPIRWPTFNADQFRSAGYGRSTKSHRSSTASSRPTSMHRPPPLPLPSLPSAGIRQGQTPRGPRPPPLSAQSPRFNLP